eukprot:Rhum_TRINITY_DN15181_c12_g1::Rhum_TRINITY_DN15181_c12_g1_i1::g.143393::m.143393
MGGSSDARDVRRPCLVPVPFERIELCKGGEVEVRPLVRHALQQSLHVRRLHADHVLPLPVRLQLGRPELRHHRRTHLELVEQHPGQPLVHPLLRRHTVPVQQPAAHVAQAPVVLVQLHGAARVASVRLCLLVLLDEREQRLFVVRVQRGRVRLAHHLDGQLPGARLAGNVGARQRLVLVGGVQAPPALARLLLPLQHVLVAPVVRQPELVDDAVPRQRHVVAERDVVDRHDVHRPLVRRQERHRVRPTRVREDREPRREPQRLAERYAVGGCLRQRLGPLLVGVRGGGGGCRERLVEGQVRRQHFVAANVLHERVRVALHRLQRLAEDDLPRADVPLRHERRGDGVHRDAVHVLEWRCRVVRLRVREQPLRVLLRRRRLVRALGALARRRRLHPARHGAADPQVAAGHAEAELLRARVPVDGVRDGHNLLRALLGGRVADAVAVAASAADGEAAGAADLGGVAGVAVGKAALEGAAVRREEELKTLLLRQQQFAENVRDGLCQRLRIVDRNNDLLLASTQDAFVCAELDNHFG